MTKMKEYESSDSSASSVNRSLQVQINTDLESIVEHSPGLGQIMWNQPFEAVALALFDRDQTK